MTITGTLIPFAQWPGMWQPTTVRPALGGTVQMASARSPDRTTRRSPARSGRTLTSGVGPGGAPATAASAASHASCVAVSPMTASWTSRPALTRCRRTVSPRTTSRVAGLKAYSRAKRLTSRGLAGVPGVGRGVGPSEPRSHPEDQATKSARSSARARRGRRSGTAADRGRGTRPSLAVSPGRPPLDTPGCPDAQCAPPPRTAAARRRAAGSRLRPDSGQGRGEAGWRHRVPHSSSRCSGLPARARRRRCG